MVVIGLPMRIIGSISLMLFKALRAVRLSSIPTPAIVALTEFFHAGAEIKVRDKSPALSNIMIFKFDVVGGRNDVLRHQITSI